MLGRGGLLDENVLLIVNQTRTMLAETVLLVMVERLCADEWLCALPTVVGADDIRSRSTSRSAPLEMNATSRARGGGNGC